MGVIVCRHLSSYVCVCVCLVASSRLLRSVMRLATAHLGNGSYECRREREGRGKERETSYCKNLKTMILLRPMSALHHHRTHVHVFMAVSGSDTRTCFSPILAWLQQDVIFSAAQPAALAPSKEILGLVPNSSSRPANIFLPNWSQGRPAAF